MFLAASTGELLGIDNVKTALTTNQQEAIARQIGRALVVGAFLQTVATGIATNGKLPSVIFLQLGNDL